MKNLANCTPREFLAQSVKIRHAVQNWLTETDIMGIRKRVPHFDGDMSDADKRKAYEAQARDNLWAIIDEITAKHPDETLELLALLNFVEPQDVDKHQMSEYFASIAELISNEAVISFFISLTRLGQMTTSKR